MCDCGNDRDSIIAELILEALKIKIRDAMTTYQCSWDEAKMLVIEQFGKDWGII